MGLIREGFMGFIPLDIINTLKPGEHLVIFALNIFLQVVNEQRNNV